PYFVFQTSLIIAFTAWSRQAWYTTEPSRRTIKWCGARGFECLPCKIKMDAGVFDPNCELLTSKEAEQKRPVLTFGGTFGAQPPQTSRATNSRRETTGRTTCRGLRVPPLRIHRWSRRRSPCGRRSGCRRRDRCRGGTATEQPAAGRDRLAGQVDDPIDG